MSILTTIKNLDVDGVLLVEPNFPTPTKSKNHKDTLPIGLLKIAGYFRKERIPFQLVKHGETNITIDPKYVFVTSSFTYYSKYVKESVEFYYEMYPDAIFVVGGIYASLMPEHCKEYTGCDIVVKGVLEEAEDVLPAYDLVDTNIQILHITRGCHKRCEYCGCYKIEPEFQYKNSLEEHIVKNRLVIYDNNFLQHPHIEEILEELIDMRKRKVYTSIEAQSGFDKNILLKKPHLAGMLKEATFLLPRIAWDEPIKIKDDVKKTVDLLVDNGFTRKNIGVFMLFNHKLPYAHLEAKRVECFKMGVRVAPCRYRPLDVTFDNYRPHKYYGQPEGEYFIHPNWKDIEIRQFLRNVRRQNLCVAMKCEVYSKQIEQRKIEEPRRTELINMKYEDIDKKELPDAWTPKRIHKLED